ncbi:MAG: hypothetical protein DRO99_04180 [Candidatus Aenigmatarchaeota archaeon]|mgnify:CR=1 FL=1|nr:MAG: hypothetical protein DRO99_04180 [Candidatus Aenigmarchaeota archaeon]
MKALFPALAVTMVLISGSVLAACGCLSASDTPKDSGVAISDGRTDAQAKPSLSGISGSIRIDDKASPAIELPVSTDRGTMDVRLERARKRGGMNITSGGVTARANVDAMYNEMSIFLMDNGALRKLDVLPDRVRHILKERLGPTAEIIDLNLTVSGGFMKYDADSITFRWLFGFFPVVVQEKSVIDAVNGKLESVSEPWWTILTIS